jgi:3-oxoacyl-[acyl-carrier-protein] synthase II
MKIYLNSTGMISGAGNSTTGLTDNGGEETVFYAKEPDYTGEIPPMQLRRMSKAVRMGIGAAKFCLKNAALDKADAISIGTAMGCLQDTEVFLGKMVEQNEQMLTPTAFIQSTHNTVAGQIALVIGCNGHNLTYVQRGHSFEHAMLNTYLHLQENPSQKVLVGGIDELTNNSITVTTEAGVYNSNIKPGEGASFFLATNEPTSAKSICVKDIHTFTTTDGAYALEQLQHFTARNNISNPDIILSGKYNDEKTDSFYDTAVKQFSTATIINFKNKCGEYPTNSAFALGLLMEMINGNYSENNTNFISSQKSTKVLLINNYLHYISYWFIEL